MAKGVLLTRLRQLVWEHLSLKSYEGLVSNDLIL
jgi:hypothetical protein